MKDGETHPFAVDKNINKKHRIIIHTATATVPDSTWRRLGAVTADKNMTT